MRDWNHACIFTYRFHLFEASVLLFQLFPENFNVKFSGGAFRVQRMRGRAFRPCSKYYLINAPLYLFPSVACWHHSIDEDTVGIPRRVEHIQFDSASGLDHAQWAEYPRVSDQHLKVERNKLCSVAVLSMTRPVQLAAFRRAVRRTATSAALFRRTKSSAASTLIVFQMNIVRGVRAESRMDRKTIIDGV